MDRSTKDENWDERPVSEPIDPEGEQRELERAGWERVHRTGKLLWKHPDSGHLYPQGQAVARARSDRAAPGGDEERERGL